MSMVPMLTIAQFIYVFDVYVFDVLEVTDCERS